MSRQKFAYACKGITSGLTNLFGGLSIQTREYVFRKNIGCITILTSSDLLDGRKLNNLIPIRTFAKRKGGDDDLISDEYEDKDDTERKRLAQTLNLYDDDPFGLEYEPGQHNLGPLPTKYKRDAVTNIFTGEIEKDLTESQRRLLKEDPTILENRLVDLSWENWKKNDTNEQMIEKYNKLGRSVRETEMSLNVLGRTVQAQSNVENLEDGSKFGIDEDGFSQHLTSKEFSNFASYMNSEFANKVTKEDLPVLQSTESGKSRRTKYDQKLGRRVPIGDDADDLEDQDERELSLKWLTARGRRAWDDDLDDNLYADLMPQHMNPARVVNRKQAKKIPPRLLHHNNVQLLQRFLTPTCQIQSRIQTRLGAKDQRKISKLIRRGRALGLLPYDGQIKVERHGWVHARDIDKLRGWEKQLIERGLVIKRKKKED
jgi:ribosomal protein S18